MPDDATDKYRIRLGPVARQHLDTWPKQTSAALDAELANLLEARSSLVEAERKNAHWDTRHKRLSESHAKMADALAEISTSVSKLTDMVDNRTREMMSTFLHISTLVGTKFADSEELEHLHRRFREITGDLETQMERMVMDVREQKPSREAKVTQATTRAKEERLTLSEQHSEAASIERQQHQRGMER